MLNTSSFSNEELLDCPKLRWGILGCGRISHDFTQALKLIPSATVVACGGRSIESAQRFAETHQIPDHYGSYEDLLSNEEIDVIYVGTIHTMHYEIGVKCLLANKHVLIEKPFTCNAQEAENLIRLAKEQKLFLMEAMWTRFFPAVEHARQLALGNDFTGGAIGDIVSVQSDFNFNASDCEEYPHSLAFDHKLGGGASYWIGSYPIAASTIFFDDIAPDQVSAVGFVDPHTGVDLQSSMSLRYSPRPGCERDNFIEEKKQEKDWNPQEEGSLPLTVPICGVSTLSCGFLGESPENTIVVGTRGRITLGSPAHAPTELTVRLKGEERGTCSRATTYKYPLPPEMDDIAKSGGFYFPNSAGLAYEAAAVGRCIDASLLECPQHPLSVTLLNTQILEEMRAQLGLCSDSF